MKIVLTENQLDKLVKTVNSKDGDLKEIDRYKFSEPRSSGKPSPQDYKDVITSNTHIKDVGNYSYYYSDSEENYTPTIRIYVLDNKNQEYVGNAEFEMRYGGDFFVTLPYIRREYRGQGIASEIYKTLLSMGDIVSGKAQSDQAVGLWLKLYNELPNKMYYVDDDGKIFDVYNKGGELFTTKTNTSVYDVKGGYLRLTKN
jgi:GNAT superfamily N-acetyltransferase